nr:RNA-directed DNA polymerase, eukaryota [Tanacetum cinerariifolium]
MGSSFASNAGEKGPFPSTEVNRKRSEHILEDRDTKVEVWEKTGMERIKERARALQSYKNDMEMIDSIAEGARSQAAKNQKKELLKVKEKADTIREWNFSHISSSRVEMKQLQEELNWLDTEIESGKVTDVTSSKRMEVINSMHNINKTHAIESLQKAKIKWLVEGNENSHFFHGILNKRRKQMSIRGVMKDGVWLDKPGQEELESAVTREEIKRAVWDCGVDKSPGPDGFMFGFYRQFWDLVEKDVILAVNYFLKHGEFSSGCNSSFIALIPKIPNANMVKDFRPISLIAYVKV